MEVRPGYKQTDVGVIPEEWAVRPCSELSERITVGIVIRPTQYYVRHGIPALRSANIREGGITDTDLVFISDASNALLAKSQTRVGDVLTVRTGYPGTSAVVHAEHAGWNCIDILITRPSKELDPEYLAIWVNSAFGKEQVLRNQGGLAQKHFNVGDMRNLLVARPPLPEQRAIAEALSDLDALLGALDHLIAKKRDLKRATMQKLLTGQARLPGFRGEWEVKRLDELGECFAGGTPSTRRPDFWGGDVFWLPSGRIQNNTIDSPSDSEITITQRGLSESAAKLIQPFSVLVAITGATCANVSLLQFETAANQSVVAIEPFEQADARFIFHALLMERGQILSRQGGSAQGGVNLKAVKGIEIQCPEQEEQAAIAAVLSDMDAELSALEARRDKTLNLKQAMRQELLTGRTRLVPIGENHA